MKIKEEIHTWLVAIGIILIIAPWWFNDDFKKYSLDVVWDDFVIFGILLILVGLGLYLRKRAIKRNLEPRGLAKRSNLITIIVVFVLVWGITGLLPMVSDLSEKSISTVSENDLEAIKIVQNYKGQDGEGSTVLETIATVVTLTYLGQDIANHPSTSMRWDAVVNIERGFPIYDVYFDFKTYDNKKEFHFVTDVNSGQVWGSDELSVNVLQVVDNEGSGNKKLLTVDPKVFCTQNTKDLYAMLKLQDLYEKDAKNLCV